MSLQVFQVQCYKTPLCFSLSLALTGTAVLAACAHTHTYTKIGSPQGQLQVKNIAGGGFEMDIEDLIGSTSGCHLLRRLQGS